jgi:hypothetical protein
MRSRSHARHVSPLWLLRVAWERRLAARPRLEAPRAPMLTNETKPSSAVRGRDVEPALIEEKLRGARDGRGATLISDGAAGFGKTRLLAEAFAAISRATA